MKKNGRKVGAKKITEILKKEKIVGKKIRYGASVLRPREKTRSRTPDCRKNKNTKTFKTTAGI